MRHLLPTLIALTVLTAPARAQNAASTAEQIKLAVIALPADLRDGATAMIYNDAGELVVGRQGTNDFICLGDKPGDERIQSACYHKSLEPFMARGRELKAQGKSPTEALEMRHQEADAGKLQLPKEPAILYNLMADLKDFDPEHPHVSLYAIYVPYATAASTGLTEKPSAPGAPWIMRPGTASAHIMVVPPSGGHVH